MTQCGLHPQTEAVGFCVSCGRGVCEACKVRVNDAAHCKECVEAGRIKGGSPQPATPQGPQAPPLPPGAAPPPPWMYPGAVYFPPRPTGTPDPGLFRIGATAALVIGVSSILIGAYSVLGLSDIFQPTWITAVILGHLPFLALLPVHYGLGKNYGVPSAMTRFMVLALMLIVSIMIWATMLAARTGGPSGFSTIIFVMAVPPILGVGFIVASGTLTAASRFIPPTHEARRSIQYAGIMMLITGILFVSYFGFLVAGWVTMAISMFLLCHGLTKAPIPEVQQQPAFPPPLPPSPYGRQGP